MVYICVRVIFSLVASHCDMARFERYFFCGAEGDTVHSHCREYYFAYLNCLFKFTFYCFSRRPSLLCHVTLQTPYHVITPLLLYRRRIHIREVSCASRCTHWCITWRLFADWNSFYADFGPLNLATLFHYCQKVNKKLKVSVQKECRSDYRVVTSMEQINLVFCLKFGTQFSSMWMSLCT